MKIHVVSRAHLATSRSGSPLLSRDTLQKHTRLVRHVVTPTMGNPTLCLPLFFLLSLRVCQPHQQVQQVQADPKSSKIISGVNRK